MNLDIYTVTAFFVGILAGVVAAFWLARFITGLTVERLERKVQSLSENKFELQGQRARLKQLEQRLDAEADQIPLAEQELKTKSEEIKELTAALNETTALTSDLTTALRARKAKAKLLQAEQTKWLKRNKALLMKSETTETEIANLQKGVAQIRDGKGKPAINGTGAASAIAAGPHDTERENPAAALSVANGHVDHLASRMQHIESELETWFERMGKLEQNVTGQVDQASSLTLLEQVLRGEAKNQEDASSDDVPPTIGSKGIGSKSGNGSAS